MRSLVFLQTFIHLSVCIVAKKAYLEIILYDGQEDGRYLIRKREINGIFSNFGTANRAEGDIVQMHPHSLCDASSDTEKFEYGWVGVVKLPFDSTNACHAAEKARSAVKKGATAVIFDISDHPGALQMLNEHSFNGLNQPIVLVNGGDAMKLMDIIQKEQIVRAVIKKSEPNKEPFGGGLRDPALLMSGLIFVLLVASFIVCRTKCRKHKQQRSLHNWMSRHSKMKKYEKRKRVIPHEFDNNTIRCYQSSVSSSQSLCAICLESFASGEDLRVLECRHEFHLNCIDVWLKQKRSCPLCNRNFSEIDKDVDHIGQHSFAPVQLSEVRDIWRSSHDNSANNVLTDTNPYTHEPSRDFITQFADHSRCSSSSSPQTSVIPDRGGCWSDQSTEGGTRSVLQENNCYLPRRITDNASFVDTRPSHMENFKDSYFLRVEGYPVPHVLNENCDRVFPHSQNPEAAPVYKRGSFGNQRSSVDNVSVLAHIGSIRTIAGERWTSPISSDAWNRAEYCSDSSEARCQRSEKPRWLTPCIEYSSSDGAGNLLRQSYSTLEDALAEVPAE